MASVKRFDLARSDLDFILEQILIAEQNALGTPLGSLIPDVFAPLGLRTVTGVFNNLVPGQSNWGAADQLFIRLLPPVWRDADPLTFDPDGPGGQAPGGTSYAQTTGWVVDAEPRMISNLISDQTVTNAAAVAAAGNNPDVSEEGTLSIPNVRPDAGLSAPLNAWFTFFGQFFDHGLDLINKGGNGLVYIPLAQDDPLFDAGADSIAGTQDDGPNFMVLSRATITWTPGADGVLGTTDDGREQVNQTTPFIDQNQTYTSHPSHQVFLREYVLNEAGDPVATGKLLDGRTAGSDGEFFSDDDVLTGGLATWEVVKASAAKFLGILLTDADVTNLPLLATDAYGRFERGSNGLPQIVTTNGLVEGNLATPVGTASAVRTGHAFLEDIAHTAAPKFLNGALNPDADNDAGNTPAPGTYDDELLNAHYSTGDGRGNENIGLTAIHEVFHSEHNRLVEEIKDVIEALDATDPANAAFIAQWKLPDGEWNGERLFQAARFSTEMQYQHLVFEEFARTVQPNIDAFGSYSSSINPAIFSEFANTVYRFGHTMLTDTVARTNLDGSTNDIGLIEAFLNPLEFAASGPSPGEAAGAIVRGLTGQVANEIDEFVTEALRNNLVGLPLDLAALNIARGRDVGIPSLNAARREFYAGTGGDSALKPYESWAEFGLGLKNPESLVNFIAAYGRHETITSENTLDAKRVAAMRLIMGGSGAPEDRAQFINSTGAWANDGSGVTTTGLDDVDFWIGGLAEKQMPFGGILGSTFGFVFETQLENLQNADRLYYLSRTAGLNFLTQLEENSFAELIMRNTDTVHLNFNVFLTPTYTIELGDPSTWPAGLVNVIPDGIRFLGDDHIVLGGNDAANHLISGGGDDAVWGDGGNDTLDGGAGNDAIIGGEGDDLITDLFGDDVLKGGEGNDTIQSGSGLDLVFGGLGDDVIAGTADDKEVFAGGGNDILSGGSGAEAAQGGGGDDWLDGRNGDDRMSGDDGNPGIPAIDNGNDVLIGGNGDDRLVGEGGDDIFIGGNGLDRHTGNAGFDWMSYELESTAVTADLLLNAAVLPPLPPSPAAFADRFLEVEGLSGTRRSDVLRGDDVTGSILANGNLINGLSNLLGGNTFTGGNIILGGDGSDTIEGRGGNDFIDGDAFLHVELTAADSTGHRDIVREIRTTADNTPDVDRAVFSGAFANYRITRNQDGTVTVLHRNNGIDGSDTLQNIEELGFTDRVVVLTDTNHAATGAPTINDTTPTEGQPLTALTAAIADADGLGGVAFAFQWESFVGGQWTNIGGATGQTFTPLQAQAGLLLRVVVSFVDQLGFFEEVSSIEAGVGEFFNGGGAGDNPLLTAYDDIAFGNDGADSLDGLAGNDRLSGGTGADTLVGGAGADTLDGGTDADTASYEDSSGVIVSLDGPAGAATGDAAGDILLAIENLRGSATGSDELSGSRRANRLEGLGGDDTLAGAGGRDTVVGGAGLDMLHGGTGSDRFQWLFLTESGNSAATADHVLDFVPGRGGDKIDLSLMTPAGDDDGVFSFMGTGAFRAGGFASVRYAQSGGNTLVELDQGDGGAAEMVIQLDGLHTLRTQDFIL